MSLSTKTLDQDQLQAILQTLLKDKIIENSTPLESILSNFNEYTANPAKQFRNTIYKLELGKAVEDVIPRFNFAIDHIGIMEKERELYFFVDGTRIIASYKYSETVSHSDVFYYLAAMTQQFDVNILRDPSTEEIEEIIGCTLET